MNELSDCQAPCEYFILTTLSLTCKVYIIPVLHISTPKLNKFNLSGVK